jgi:hypothetical protein
LTFLVWPGRTFTVFLMVAIVITSNPPELIDRQAQHALLRAVPREVRLPRAYPRKVVRGDSLTPAAPVWGCSFSTRPHYPWGATTRRNTTPCASACRNSGS